MNDADTDFSAADRREALNLGFETRKSGVARGLRAGQDRHECQARRDRGARDDATKGAVGIHRSLRVGGRDATSSIARPSGSSIMNALVSPKACGISRIFT